MAADDKSYSYPQPHQSPVPAAENSLPRIGDRPPGKDAASLPRLGTAGGRVVITRGRGPGAE